VTPIRERLAELTDEEKALTVGAVSLFAGSIAATVVGFGFPERTVVGLATGFAGLIVASLLLTGRPIPPDDEDEEYETEL